MIEIGTRESGALSDLIELEAAEAWSGGVKRVVNRYKGNHAECKTQAGIYGALGYDASAEPIEGTPKSILTIIQPDAEPGGDPEDAVFPYWELTTTIEELDSWEHPIPAAYLAGLSSTARKTFVDEIDAAEAGGDYPPSYSGLSSSMKGFVDSRIAKIKTVFLPRPTLRLTRVVPAFTTVVIGYGDMLSLFTTSELLSSGLVTSFPLPDSIGTLPTGDWLSVPPAQIQQQDRKVQIVYEFIYRPTGGWGTWQYA